MIWIGRRYAAAAVCCPIGLFMCYGDVPAPEKLNMLLCCTSGDNFLWEVLSMPMELLIGFLIGAVLAGVISGSIFFKRGIEYRKAQAENAIGSAEKEAERIIEAANEEADIVLSSLKTLLLCNQNCLLCSNLRNNFICGGDFFHDHSPQVPFRPPGDKQLITRIFLSLFFFFPESHHSSSSYP